MISGEAKLAAYFADLARWSAVTAEAWRQIGTAVREDRAAAERRRNE